MTSDDLLNIFREEAADHLTGLNAGLLKVEMATGDERSALLREMNRLAHSMKGAARAVGMGRIETISHYMEEVFHYALNKGLEIAPAMADALYDGLDLIQNTLNSDDIDEAVIAEVLANLERIVTLHSETGNGQAKPKKPPKAKPSKPKRAAKHITQDSEELPVVQVDAPAPAPLLKVPGLTEEGFTTPTDTGSSLMPIFRAEVEEHLTSLNDALLKVEMAQGDEERALLREMNRVAHSMKGAARAVGFGVIESISHYMEEVFHEAQTRALPITPDVADALYDALDVIQATLAGTPPEEAGIHTLLTHLSGLAHNNRATVPATTALPAVVLPPAAPPPAEERSPNIEIPALTTPAPMPPGTPPFTASEAEPIRRTTETGKYRAVSTHEKTVVDGLSSVPPFSVMHSSSAAPGDTSTATMMLRPPEESIRVAVSKLDALMAETGELIVARMQNETRLHAITEMRRLHARWRREWRSVRTSYIRLARRMQEQGSEIAAELHALFKFLQTNEDYLNETNRALAQLGQQFTQDTLTLTALADSLQDNVADLRMMPFETIISGFQRMARDLARDTHKQVQLEVVGGAVEVDKTVLDALKDPLMHLLRNAVDHGIEAPRSREASGKPATGHILLTIEQRGTEIVLKVQDDGHGIDVQRIRKKAVAIGLMSEAEAAALDDDSARLLIFESGFSTSDQVTAISGRGLGMDIVRDRIESLRGRISIASALGEGTIITLNVPVSLTRIRAILLRVGDEEYAIPATMVVRMATLNRSDIFTAEGREMVMLNQRPMPLVALGALLDTPNLPPERGETLTVIALQAVDRPVAFEVEALQSEQELVLKPLGPELLNTPYIAGAALLGTGQVVLILDANDLVRGAYSGATPLRRAGSTRVRPRTARSLRILVVDDSITTRTLEKNILEAVGFEVHVAIDGVEAWELLADIDPDVIISDVEMPNMNGLELTRRIKGHPQTQDIPVILLTSLGKPEQREEGLRAGADAYLIKSRFDQGELLETIQSVM